jgi:hypothetical protein
MGLSNEPIYASLDEGIVLSAEPRAARKAVGQTKATAASAEGRPRENIL